MKAFMKSTFATLLVGALLVIGAYAGDKDKTEKKMITFTDDIMVNGTLVKAGDYEIKFDESTNELSIIKNGKVKAKTPAHLEARAEKAKNTQLRTAEKGGSPELIGVTFGGWTQDVVVGTGSASNGTQ